MPNFAALFAPETLRQREELEEELLPLEPGASMAPDATPNPASAPAVIPEDEEHDPLALVRAKLREKLFANNMEAMKPKDPTPNPNRLSSDIARAGSMLGAAIANTKADTTFADTLDKRGTEDAFRADKAAMDETNFNQQMGLQLLHPDKLKAEKDPYDPLLNDPNSAPYKQKEAMLKAGAPKFWAKVQESTKAGGKPWVDLNESHLGMKVKDIISQEQATGRTALGVDAKVSEGQKNRDATAERQLVGIQASFDRMGLADAYKANEDSRKSMLPNRAKRPNTYQTAEQAKTVARKDADALVAKAAIQDLIQFANTLSPAERLNPWQNQVVQKKHQDILNKIRVNEQFGVPSGKDMEQLARLVSDPSSFSQIIRDQSFEVLDDLANSVARDADITADQYGYMEWKWGAGRGAGGPEVPEKVAGNLKAKYGPKPPTPAPTTTPPAGQKLTPSGKPYAKSVKKKSGAVVYIDSEGNVVE